LLLALAVLIPILVPAAQRSDVLIMTILFGLTGALLLFTAMLPDRNPDRNPGRSSGRSSGRSRGAGDTQARSVTMPTTSWLQSRPQSHVPSKVKPVKAGWGIALGLTFVLAGFIAPFILGATSADERFVIMLGFAPVVVAGFFMIAIFGRSLFRFPQSSAEAAEAMPKPAGGAATVHVGVNIKRAPVMRVPQTLEYKAIVPIAIVSLLVIMVIVVGLVIAATVASAVR
jgi:hypothetical protein